MQMKENIHKLVAQKYRASIPELQDINAFLKLHWSLVGLRQGQVLTAWQIAYPAVFSVGAWKLLFASVYSRRIARKTDWIRQEDLFAASNPMAAEVLSVV